MLRAKTISIAPVDGLLFLTWLYTSLFPSLQLSEYRNNSTNLSKSNQVNQ